MSWDFSTDTEYEAKLARVPESIPAFLGSASRFREMA